MSMIKGYTTNVDGSVTIGSWNDKYLPDNFVADESVPEDGLQYKLIKGALVLDDEANSKAALDKQLAEAKQYLTETDFYMTVDKYEQLDEAKKLELRTNREEARTLIRDSEDD